MHKSEIVHWQGLGCGKGWWRSETAEEMLIHCAQECLPIRLATPHHAALASCSVNLQIMVASL